jgi:hypothetical protein
MSATNSEGDGKVRRKSMAGGRRGRAVPSAIATGAALLAATGLTATGLTAPAVALAGLAPAGQAAPAAAGWKIVKTVHGRGGAVFTAVTAPGARDAWAFEAGAVTSRPAAFRLSGTTWKQVTFPGQPGEVVQAAGSSSAANVWAIALNLKGSKSRALRWNGSHWSATGTLPASIDDVAVISRSDVWAFGSPFFPGNGGAWHFNGHRWQRQPAGHGLSAGSALSARSIWAIDGKSVAHWNGSRWRRTSVARLLPPASQLSSPRLTAILARSASNVWAIGSGGRQDEGGPVVVLHFNGHRWSRSAIDRSAGEPGPAQVAPDGSAGLWIPVPSVDGIPFRMLRFAAGHLRAVTMPVSGRKLDVLAVAAHGSTAFGAGLTHSKDDLAAHMAGVVLEFS